MLIYARPTDEPLFGETPSGVLVNQHEKEIIMAQYRSTPRQLHDDRLKARVEPTKGYTYQICRYDADDRFVNTIATLDCHGLDRANRQFAQMLCAAPDMMRLLLDIFSKHQNDLPADVLDRIATTIDNTKE